MPLRLFNCTTGELETTTTDGEYEVLCVTGNHRGWYADISKCDLTHIDWDLLPNGNLRCPKCGTVASQGAGQEGAWWTGTNIIWYMTQHPDQEYDSRLAHYKLRADAVLAKWNSAPIM